MLISNFIMVLLNYCHLRFYRLLFQVESFLILQCWYSIIATFICWCPIMLICIIVMRNYYRLLSPVLPLFTGLMFGYGRLQTCNASAQLLPFSLYSDWFMVDVQFTLFFLPINCYGCQRLSMRRPCYCNVGSVSAISVMVSSIVHSMFVVFLYITQLGASVDQVANQSSTKQNKKLNFLLNTSYFGFHWGSARWSPKHQRSSSWPSHSWCAAAASLLDKFINYTPACISSPPGLPMPATFDWDPNICDTGMGTLLWKHHYWWNEVKVLICKNELL